MARTRKQEKCAFYETCGNMASAIVCGGYNVCSSCQKEVEDADDVDDGHDAEAPPAPAPTKKDNKVKHMCYRCEKPLEKSEIMQWGGGYFCLDCYRRYAGKDEGKGAKAKVERWTCPLCCGVMLMSADIVGHFRKHYQDAGLI
jgi:hypothetical protein